MQFYSFFIHILLCILSFFSFYEVHAISVVKPNTNALIGSESVTPTIQSASNIIGNIISWMIGLVAVLTILAITWAAIQMILAVGDEEKMKKSRHTMIYAFIGLIIAGLAYALVNFVTNLNFNNIF